MAYYKDYTKDIEAASVILDGARFIFYGENVIAKNFWGENVYMNTPAFQVVQSPKGYLIIPIVKKRKVPDELYTFPQIGGDLINRLIQDPDWHGFSIPVSGGKYKEVKVSFEGGHFFFDAEKTDAYHLTQRKKPEKRKRDPVIEDENPGHCAMGFYFTADPEEASRVCAEITEAVRQVLKKNKIKHYSDSK